MRTSLRWRGRQASTARPSREHAIIIANTRSKLRRCSERRRKQQSNNFRGSDQKPLLCERGENACPRANPLVKAPQVVFLVRRMDIVVVECKAHQKRVQTEHPLE